jgi:2-keto-4-pentenoate hydratase/2-oxohepta-3-ene-1,7-dioic acid hydratase in catechol pathway
MRMASVLLGGKDTFGLVRDDGFVDLGARFGSKFGSLKALIGAGALDEARAFAEAAADAPLDSLAFRPVVPDADKVLCIGVNYRAHRDEMGRADSAHPMVFTRFSNVQVGHEQPIVRPRVSAELDFEGELAIVVGRRGRHISEDEALGHLAGYSIFQDATARDWQRHTTQFTPGKNFMNTGGFGPWLVTPDELGDPTQLTLTTRLNGREMQRTTTDLMLCPIPRILAYVSTFVELVPGDVIATGTPGGVGVKRSPPVFMQPGDVVEVEISRIGVLRNPIVAE